MIDLLLRDTASTDLLSADEEIGLAERINLGDPDARDHLVRSNIKLVVRVAQDFRGRGVEIEDLVAEGSIGLMRAAEGWNPQPGIRFASFAYSWISQAMRRAVARDSRTIRLPRSTVALVARWRAAKANLSDRLGRTPEDDEVAAEMNLPRRKVRLVLKAIRIGSNVTVADDERDTMGEIVDWRTRSTDEAIEDRDSLEWLACGMTRLNAAQMEVLNLRYGLDGNGPRNWPEIGRAIDRHRDTARAIEASALAKLSARA